MSKRSTLATSALGILESLSPSGRSHGFVGVLIQATLPCVIRPGEEDLGLQGMGDVLMRSELFSVVEGDGVHEVADRLEVTHGCPLCCVGGRTRQLDDFGQLGSRQEPKLGRADDVQRFYAPYAAFCSLKTVGSPSRPRAKASSR